VKYLKAIYAGLMSGIGSTSAAYVAGGGHIGVVAGLTIAGTVASAVAVVWGVTNASAASAA
jgi:hypothetical protein